jgi:hypothetical protein
VLKAKAIAPRQKRLRRPMFKSKRLPQPMFSTLTEAH